MTGAKSKHIPDMPNGDSIQSQNFLPLNSRSSVFTKSRAASPRLTGIYVAEPFQRLSLAVAAHGPSQPSDPSDRPSHGRAKHGRWVVDGPQKWRSFG